MLKLAALGQTNQGRAPFRGNCAFGHRVAAVAVFPSTVHTPQLAPIPCVHKTTSHARPARGQPKNLR